MCWSPSATGAPASSVITLQAARPCPGLPASAAVAGGARASREHCRHDRGSPRSRREVSGVTGCLAGAFESPEVSPCQQHEYLVMGATPSPVGASIQISEGSFITQTNVASVARVAVLGPTTRDDLFGTGANAVGKRVRVNGIDFRVVGVRSQGRQRLQQPRRCICAVTSVQRLLAGDTHLSRSRSRRELEGHPTSRHRSRRCCFASQDLRPHGRRLQRLVAKRHAATASTITGTFTMCSHRSLDLAPVGGIGIMNMMLTPHLERTVDRASQGGRSATQRHLRAVPRRVVALTFLGGLIGVLLGFGVSWALTSFAASTRKSRCRRCCLLPA